MGNIEDVRRYWDSRPCNIRHSTAPLGSRQYFDEVEARKYTVEPYIPTFANFTRWSHRSVLEVGCGIGTDTINFVRAGAYVTAIDLSAIAVELTRQRAHAYGIQHLVDVNQQDVEQYEPYGTNIGFDLIYAWGSLHHTPHPDVALSQLRKHCHPDTILKVMVYHRWSTKAIGLALRHGQVARWSEAQFGCPVTHLFSRRQARAWFKRAGFEVTSMKVTHVFPWRVKDYIEHRYVKRWYYRHWPRWAWSALESALGWHLLIEGRPV